MEEQPVLRALRGETVRGQVVEIQPPGKKPTWISVSAAPIRAEDQLVGAVAAAADVSALQELQSQLEDLLRAVSHDLRNPLQIILLQAERLQRLAEAGGEDREKERRSSAAVVAASRQMGAMIRDLVDAVRMESGRLRLACQPLDLRAWLPRSSPSPAARSIPRASRWSCPATCRCAGPTPPGWIACCSTCSPTPRPIHRRAAT